MQQNLDLALKFLQFVLWIVGGIYVWQQGRHRATRTQVTELKDRFHQLELDLVELRERVGHLPTAQQMSDLAITMRQTTTMVEGLQRQLAVAMRLDRIEHYLHGEGG